MKRIERRIRRENNFWQMKKEDEKGRGERREREGRENVKLGSWCSRNIIDWRVDCDPQINQSVSHVWYSIFSASGLLFVSQVCLIESTVTPGVILIPFPSSSINWVRKQIILISYSCLYSSLLSCPNQQLFYLSLTLHEMEEWREKEMREGEKAIVSSKTRGSGSDPWCDLHLLSLFKVQSTVCISKDDQKDWWRLNECQILMFVTKRRCSSGLYVVFLDEKKDEDE